MLRSDQLDAGLESTITSEWSTVYATIPAKVQDQFTKLHLDCTTLKSKENDK